MATVNIKNIDPSPSRMGRAKENRQKIKEYTELLSSGVVFDPVIVWDDGKKYWMSDGWHRLQAHIACEKTEIDADLRKGSRRDAEWHALGSNKHGLPLSTADKRKRVEIALEDPEWSEESDRTIARHCGVSHTMVAYIRNEPTKKAKPPREPKAPEPKDEWQNLPPEEDKDDHLVQALVEENQNLTKKLALATLPPEERDAASKLIDELREEVKALQIELHAVTQSRDTYQRENAQLKKQVQAQTARLKKLERDR